MAVANTKFTVLLVGKTGMGKSTTGNKLLNATTEDNPKGNSNIQMRWPLGHDGKQNFATAKENFEESVTKGCFLMSSKGEDGEIQVLDTEGFSGSDFTDDVRRGNLEIIRQIVGVSSELELAFNRVLYFLPIRGRLEKADKVLQDEIDVLWHFFDEDIFKHLVLVSTISEDYPPTHPPDSDKVQRVFSSAMKLALKTSDVPPCPPVLFIPWDIDSTALVQSVKSVQVLADKAFKPEFRREVCTKCAAALYWKDTTLKSIKVGTKFHGPDHDMCHPFFIPKHSKLVRFFGGIAHVAVLGFAKVHELRTKEATWPGFFDSQEVCANCNNAPGAVGCMAIKETYQGTDVRHSNVLQAIQPVTGGNSTIA